MNGEPHHSRTRARQVSSALTAAAILLGALALAKAMSLRGQDLAVGRAYRLDEQDPNALDEYLHKARATADSLKQGNLFVKQPPKEHPVKQVDGILGDEAWIADKWHKVGAEIGEATIVRITPTEVIIAWNGQERAFSPITAGGGEPPPPRPEPAKPPTERRAEPPKPPTEAAPAQASVPPVPTEADPLAWMGVTLPASVKAKLLEHWNSMSDEDKKKAKEEWNKMPEEQKQKAVEAMEQHM